MRVADTKHGKTCASESPALLVGRGFAYHARTLTTHRSNVCCVFLCVLPEDCWAKEKLLAVWENPISILHSFFFPPRRPCAIHKIHAQTARIPCAFWGNTFWWSLFYIPDLFINMTLLSSTANPSGEFVGGRSVWRWCQNGWFIQDRDIKTRYRWIEYFLLNCNVL